MRCVATCLCHTIRGLERKRVGVWVRESDLKWVKPKHLQTQLHPRATLSSRCHFPAHICFMCCHFWFLLWCDAVALFLSVSPLLCLLIAGLILLPSFFVFPFLYVLATFSYVFFSFLLACCLFALITWSWLEITTATTTTSGTKKKHQVVKKGVAKNGKNSWFSLQKYLVERGPLSLSTKLEELWKESQCTWAWMLFLSRYGHVFDIVLKMYLFYVCTAPCFSFAQAERREKKSCKQK